jgi:hypothetical protein
METSHDRMVRSEHGDSGRKEHKAGNNWQETTDRAQDQQANPDDSADDVPHIPW